MEKCTIRNREKAAEMITDSIKNHSKTLFMLCGAKGSGRKYVLNLVGEELFVTHRIFGLFDNEIFELNKKHKKYEYHAEINFSFYAGISLSASSNQSSKLNYIISTLRRYVKKRPICFLIPNVDRVSGPAIDFLKNLLEHREYISGQIKQPIFFIFSAKKGWLHNFDVDLEITLEDYDKNDIIEFLVQTHQYDARLLAILDRNINTLYKLCGTNFNLINSFHENILYGDSNRDIDSILHEKIAEYIESGAKDSLNAKDMKLILEISSLCLSSFNKSIVAKVSQCNENDVELCLKYAREEYFLENFLDNYDFISDEIKQKLAVKALDSYQSRYVDFYNFVTANNEDDYYQRVAYLSISQNYNESELLSLLLLAIRRAATLRDDSTRLKVEDIIRRCNNHLLVQVLENYMRAIDLHIEGDCVLSNSFIDKIDTALLNVVSRAVVTHLKMRNMQLANAPADKLRVIAAQLYETAKNPLQINPGPLFYHNEEYALKLSIIYDLAPYYLDDENNQDVFNDLFAMSQAIARKLHLQGGDCTYADYIINIFNRKAFLYASPENSIVYYNQALAYFEANKIYDQIAITLSGRAGMEIAMQCYEEAIKDCRKAQKLIETYGLIIPQSEKIQHNLLIAEFLQYEKTEGSYINIKKYADKTIKKLKTFLCGEHTALEHVTLTNIASLYLYGLDLYNYKQTKRQLEKSLGCNDVSDVANVNVNDFYRYHFAWFEFYVKIVQSHWDEAQAIIDSLEDFCAVLMKNEAKHKARILVAKRIIETRCVPAPYQYCANMTKDFPNIHSHLKLRGLMLSDLQFTSYN